MRARILVLEGENGPSVVMTPRPVPALEMAQDVVRNFSSYPQQVPLFESHQYGRALGWVKSLELQSDGLWAEVELTEEGEGLVNGGAYKYVSPGLVRDLELPDGNKLEGWVLIEVSLTNMPAQYGAAIIQMHHSFEVLQLQREDWRANNDPFGYPLEAESSWDADASEARWRRYVSDSGIDEWGEREWRRYRRRFLAYDANATDKVGGYKLPVVDIIDGRPRLVRRALIAAKAAIRGARGGVDLPEGVKRNLLDRIDGILTEEVEMTREELLSAIGELLQPLVDRVAQIEGQLQQQLAQHQQLELERKVDSLVQEIASWRFGDGTEAIPPAVARSYAVMLARMPEPDRSEAMAVLRQAPPVTVPVLQLSRAGASGVDNGLSPLVLRYAEQLGVAPEAVAKYGGEQ